MAEVLRAPKKGYWGGHRAGRQANCAFPRKLASLSLGEWKGGLVAGGQESEVFLFSSTWFVFVTSPRLREPLIPLHCETETLISEGWAKLRPTPANAGAAVRTAATTFGTL